MAGDEDRSDAMTIVNRSPMSGQPRVQLAGYVTTASLCRFIGRKGAASADAVVGLRINA